jgi:hypothetical protein
MHLTRLLGVIVLIAAGSGPARADILVWRDAAGVSHYTNDLANVPPEYRAEAMTVARDWARAAPSPEPVAMPAAATVAANPGALPAARDGYEAAYLAGFRAGKHGEPAYGSSPASAGSLVQNEAVSPQSGVVADRLVPALVDRHQSRAPQRDASRDADLRDRFLPSEPSPFLQDPAGSPPVSAR